jgi:steroid 5-alpha reductase family enzyme
MSDIGILLAALLLYANLWFGVSLAKSRNDVADVAWGLGFVGIAWLSFALGEVANWQALAINSLVTLWGIRLAWHISSRHAKGPEDSRYRAWRDAWGKHFVLRSYLQVFVLQGLLMLLVALPVVLVNWYAMPVTDIFSIVGIAVFGTGFAFEAVSDAQLRAFLADSGNRGKLMTAGLWAYSRHPNYFGEVLLWWGIGMVSLGTGEWYGLLGSAAITVLIVFVSGIPMLERKYAGREDWEAYRKRTNVFFPWPRGRCAQPK